MKIDTLGYLLCAVAALRGSVAIPLAFLLFLEGGQRIPAGEAGLLSLLDVVPGPLWMWVAFGETPGNGGTER